MKLQDLASKKCVISFLSSVLLFSVAGYAQTQSAGAPVQLSLNGDSMGNAANTTELTSRLVSVFKDRESNGVFRPRTNEIEKTVFLDAERTVSIADYARMFAAAESAGAGPIAFPYAVPVKRDVKPNPLTLLIFAGQPPKFMDVSSGLEISFVGQMQQPDVPEPALLTVKAEKNDSLSLGAKPVTATTLRTALAARLASLKPDRRILFADVSDASNFGPLRDIAIAAAGAGCKKLFIVTANTVVDAGDATFSISLAWQEGVHYKDGGIHYYGPGTSMSLDIEDLTDDFMQKSAIPGSTIDKPATSITEKDLSDELDREYSRRTADNYSGKWSLLKVDGVKGLLFQNDSGGLSWMAFRKKNDKVQLIRFEASGPSEQSAFRQREFAAILNSIKFKR